jgi:hypothetical protein
VFQSTYIELCRSSSLKYRSNCLTRMFSLSNDCAVGYTPVKDRTVYMRPCGFEQPIATLTPNKLKENCGLELFLKRNLIRSTVLPTTMCQKNFIVPHNVLLSSIMLKANGDGTSTPVNVTKTNKSIKALRHTSRWIQPLPLNLDRRTHTFPTVELQRVNLQ